MDDILCYSVEHVRAQVRRAQDAGVQDAGVQDAGVQDAGAQDAGAQDAGAQDAGAQDAGSQESRGFFEVRFYTEDGRPSREQSGSIETFYYYPSGGTIRDREMNIVFYEPKLDKYHTSSRDA